MTIRADKIDELTELLRRMPGHTSVGGVDNRRALRAMVSAGNISGCKWLNKVSAAAYEGRSFAAWRDHLGVKVLWLLSCGIAGVYECEVNQTLGAENRDYLMQCVRELLEAQIKTLSGKEKTGDETMEATTSKEFEWTGTYNNSINKLLAIGSKGTAPDFGDILKGYVTGVDGEVIAGLKRSLATTTSEHAKLSAKHGVTQGELDDALKRLRVKPKSVIAKSPKGELGAATIPEGTPQKVLVTDRFSEANLDPRFKGMEVTVWDWEDINPFVPECDENYTFVHDLDMLLLIVDAIENRTPLWITGPTGCGKTTGINNYCSRTGWMSTGISFDSELGRSDVLGKDKLSVKDSASMSHFLEGVLPKAMKFPIIFVGDEQSCARADIVYFLQPVLTDWELPLPESDTGETIVAHPYFRYVALCNTVGRGDDTGLYPACRVLPAPFMNRFGSFHVAKYMTPDVEADVLKKMVAGLNDDEAAKCAQFAEISREAFLQQRTAMPVSLRNLSALAQKWVDHKDVKFAVTSSIINGASDLDKSVLRDLAANVFGVGMD